MGDKLCVTDVGDPLPKATTSTAPFPSRTGYNEHPKLICIPIGGRCSDMRKLFTFKYARVFYGTFTLILGGIFAMFPMIPLGYIFLFIGAYLLQHRIPIFRNLMKWLRKQDKKGRLQRFEDKVDRFFQKKRKRKK